MSQDTTKIETDKKDQPLERTFFWFYRNIRFFCSLIISLVIFTSTKNSFGYLISFVISSLFLDWWLFSVQKKKESERAPEWYLQWRNITPEQIDKYTSFAVMLRRIAAVIGGIWGSYGYFFLPPFKGDADVFCFKVWISYVCISYLIILISGLFRFIKIPHCIELGFASNTSNSTCGMSNPGNTMGWYHPMSPNYVFRN